MLRADAVTVVRNNRTLCRDLDLTIEAGSCWAILGPNGIGKSTLLHALAALYPLAAGHITLLNRPLSHWRRRDLARSLGVLLQDSDTLFPITALAMALSGRYPHRRATLWHHDQGDDLAAQQALAVVGLTPYAQHDVSRLSGGERRRAALARVLAQDPLLLLLDEPTVYLDTHHQIQILDHISQHWRNKGGAICMVLHDINLAARYCDHLLCLFADGSHEQGSTSQILQQQCVSRLMQRPMVPLQSATGQRAWLPE
ncbi:MAG: ABC transporter ATP-binding protein [Magnetococcales bacterium]|nr:ABC transporter ATP-binding protein [Magnetococcales bacterium]